MKYVHRKLKLLRHVKQTEMLTGPHDVMAIIEGENLDHLLNFILENIRGINGIERTITNIIASSEK